MKDLRFFYCVHRVIIKIVIDMKNKNGFTLIELIVVVAIMALLGTVITVSLTGTLQGANQDECDEFVREVEDAACVYSQLSNKKVICNRNDCAPIKLDILFSEGMIESEVDACTGKPIDLEETVSITWDDTGEKHCEYNGVKVYER